MLRPIRVFKVCENLSTYVMNYIRIARGDTWSGLYAELDEQIMRMYIMLFIKFFSNKKHTYHRLQDARAHVQL